MPWRADWLPLWRGCRSSGGGWHLGSVVREPSNGVLIHWPYPRQRNLYEVFVLFTWMTTAFYLYYESHYKTRAMGAFVMLVVSAGVLFGLVYAGA